MRIGEIHRKTGETDIRLTLDIDGSGLGDINTGIGFLDHMLTLFAKHSGFNLNILCYGDTHVDFHHTVEDIGICMGAAVLEALGEMRGICRYGDIMLPMDETLILCAVDISGRGYLGYDVLFEQASVGNFDSELLEEFLLAFTRKSGITVHMRKLAGKNTHHIIEGCYKALARALAKAVKIDINNPAIPSTKGVI